MAEKQSKNKWHTPAERIMMLGFAAVILLGTILLCLPVSAADGKSVYWLDALFTATTSVCVTGLVTVPTATTWSTFGKIVILGLIQFGGLGIMACLTMVFLILRRKISLQSRKLIQDTYNLPAFKGQRRYCAEAADRHGGGGAGGSLFLQLLVCAGIRFLEGNRLQPVPLRIRLLQCRN